MDGALGTSKFCRVGRSLPGCEAIKYLEPMESIGRTEVPRFSSITKEAAIGRNQSNVFNYSIFTPILAARNTIARRK